VVVWERDKKPKDPAFLEKEKRENWPLRGVCWEKRGLVIRKFRGEEGSDLKKKFVRKGSVETTYLCKLEVGC